MNRSLDISFHGWRGLGSDDEPDLFFWRWRLGVVTLTLCRVCVLAAYQDMKVKVHNLRATIESAVIELEDRR